VTSVDPRNSEQALGHAPRGLMESYPKSMYYGQKLIPSQDMSRNRMPHLRLLA
jgi:hypothetical protein